MTNTASIDGGVMAAVLTPLDADIAPDHGRWLDHCRNLLEQGCTGLAVLGTTGEALLQRFGTVRHARCLGSSDIDAGLSSGVGCCAIPDTVALCQMALDIEQQGY